MHCAGAISLWWPWKRVCFTNSTAVVFARHVFERNNRIWLGGGAHGREGRTGQGGRVWRPVARPCRPVTELPLPGDEMQESKVVAEAP